MTVDEAYSLVVRAVETGRAAHGYLVCGDLRGECDALVGKVLRFLFPDQPEQVAQRCHPDVAWLEPEGRSRTIHVKSMREGIVGPMSATAFSGGWKVGVVVGADRMEEEAANSFLKTLEEPPPKTMFLLLTDQPDAILPTIVSRTQRIDLPMPSGMIDGEARAVVERMFTATGVGSAYDRACIAHRLAEVLENLKDEAEPEDVALVRKAFYKTVMGCVRGWMVSGALPRHLAFRNVEAVEEAYRRSSRYISDETVLCSMADKIAWP